MVKLVMEKDEMTNARVDEMKEMLIATKLGKTNRIRRQNDGTHVVGNYCSKSTVADGSIMSNLTSCSSVHRSMFHQS